MLNLLGGHFMKKPYSLISFLYKNSLFRCLGVLAIILTVLFLDACSQTPSQKDFYGTWVYKDKTSEMTYIISEKTLSAKFTGSLFSRNTGTEILSWRKIINEDTSTRADYPAGVEVELKYHGETTLERLFIHRDKTSLINDAEPNNIYIKYNIEKSDTPVISYDKVEWEAPSSDIIKAYNLNPKDLLNAGEGISMISQKNPSEQIRLRIFNFYDNKLMNVYVYYNNVVKLEDLMTSLSSKYGVSSPPRTSDDGSCTIITYDKYLPKLSVDIQIQNDTKDIYVGYSWVELFDKWKESRSQDQKVEL
jgi:hypothetical protein